MKGRHLWCCLLLLTPAFTQAQQIYMSEPQREDGKEMNFDIIGKVSKNVLVLKNTGTKYSINVYNESMSLLNKSELDFLPIRTIDVGFITYADYFYFIYQYKRKGIIYCMAAKIDGNGKKMSVPQQLDTAVANDLSEHKIFTVINSDDKKKIMIFRIQTKDERLHFTTLLFDSQLQPIHRSNRYVEYNERKDIVSDFFVDNAGNFIFNISYQKKNHENASEAVLVTKAALQDSFNFHPITFDKNYADEIKIKIDNLNQKYILTSFYYKDRSNDIQGILCNIWDAVADSMYASVYTEFSDELRSEARISKDIKSALNGFFIRNLSLKKDGSFILSAEDFLSQTSGSNWNRYDYMNGLAYLNPNDYHFYNPINRYYYQPPYGTFSQSTRYYYDNVLVVSFNSKGIPEWKNVIHKQQQSDNNDNYLSFNTINIAGELHFLYNDISKRDQLLSDNVMTVTGESRRNPTLKTEEPGYEFMPRFAKQISSRNVVIPCTYRGLFCFANISY